jgi:outer membrane protein assembly factor BamB
MKAAVVAEVRFAVWALLSSACVLFLPSTATPAFAENWPHWRGPLGMGVSSEKGIPLRWGTNDNLQWKTPLSEPGNSTPIVWGNRVFVTQASEESGRRLLLCFDRTNGKLLWQQGATFSAKEATHDTNPHGSSSPVTDGERVVAWFGSGGLYCYDLDGKELWHRELGAQRHIWGWGASPILVGELCILNFGPGDPSFLVAVNKTTGTEVWRLPEPNGDSGEKKTGNDKTVWAGSWSTPIAARVGGGEQLILSWPGRVIGLEPKTGTEIWTCSGLNPLVYTSPLFHPAKEIVVAMGGYNGMALAVKAGGSGDVTKTRRLWHHPKTKQRIGSGVIHEDHIYVHTDPGIAECWELESGKLVWEERLRGPGAKGDNWSSMVLADGRLYTVNQGGDAFVLRASPKFEVLFTNSIHETTIASMAISGGQIFIRSHRNLWCVGQK